MVQQGLIYAVDDEAPIREVYQYALEGAGFTVACFSCAAELYQALERKLPDLFLLDIMLDGEDGYTILSHLRAHAKCAEIPVIMVSAKTSEMDKVKGLNLGADDYLVKPFGVMELIARVRAHLRNRKGAQNSYVYADLTVDDDRHMVTVGDAEVSLTLKQYELLKLLIKHAGTVLARDRLLDAVWGENYGETRTLDIHIAELRKALGASKAQIQTIRGVGYLLK